MSPVLEKTVAIEEGSLRLGGLAERAQSPDGYSINRFKQHRLIILEIMNGIPQPVRLLINQEMSDQADELQRELIEKLGYAKDLFEAYLIGNPDVPINSPDDLDNMMVYLKFARSKVNQYP